MKLRDVSPWGINLLGIPYPQSKQKNQTNRGHEVQPSLLPGQLAYIYLVYRLETGLRSANIPKYKLKVGAA
jgi:hypothetical protein